MIGKTPRIFLQAQATKPIPLVPFVWAATPTMSTTATSPKFGAISSKPSANESKESCSSGETTLQYVPIGKDLAAVPLHDTTTSIIARVVDKPRMEPRHVLELRRCRPLTPYHPNAWEQFLIAAELMHVHGHVLTGLRHGFHVNFPTIISTQTPPNRDSILEHANRFAEIVSNEMEKGRYIGPFSRNLLEDLIGPFQSSPFSIIPKLGRIDKYRNIQNYSFPLRPSFAFPNPSINSYINSDDFPTTWGTFSLISLLIRRLPPDSQIATRDVSEAYHTIPLHHSQWPAAVVRIAEDEFAVDTSNCFGSAPSAGVYGAVRNAAADIIRFHGIGPLSSWVDDHFFAWVKTCYIDEYNCRRQEWHNDIVSRGLHQNGGRLWFGGRTFEDGTIEEFDEDCRFPCKDLSRNSPRSPEDCQYSYNFDDIDFVSEQLGIPWERTKDLPFGPSTTYIGFEWNASSYQVSLGTSKKAKYLQAVLDWQTQATHTLNDVEKL